MGLVRGPQDSNDQFGVLKDIHAETTPGFTYQHPSGAEEESVTRHGPGFIDNQIDIMELATHFRYGKTCYKCQEGSLPKCSYGTLQFKFSYHKNGDTASIKSNDENPGNISLQPHHQLLPRLPLKRLAVSEGE